MHDLINYRKIAIPISLKNSVEKWNAIFRLEILSHDR